MRQKYKQKRREGVGEGGIVCDFSAVRPPTRHPSCVLFVVLSMSARGLGPTDPRDLC